MAQHGPSPTQVSENVPLSDLVSDLVGSSEFRSAHNAHGRAVTAHHRDRKVVSINGEMKFAGTLRGHFQSTSIFSGLAKFCWLWARRLSAFCIAGARALRRRGVRRTGASAALICAIRRARRERRSWRLALALRSRLRALDDSGFRARSCRCSFHRWQVVCVVHSNTDTVEAR